MYEYVKLKLIKSNTFTYARGLVLRYSDIRLTKSILVFNRDSNSAVFGHSALSGECLCSALITTQ